ncbi:Fungal specific transcription factor domain-containing protein [Cladophialophora immunda]|nr:Fungal specific transcription factor domain-containing protein [Cladophialophora immunda]
MPLIPYERRPVTSEQILTMATREPHFMAAILVVATGLLGEYTLHHHLWQRAERLFAQVAIMGTNESLEMIEGLLLLSEYPPNMGHSTGLGFEDRMCWMTVGTAVRLGYLRGLEQLVMQPDDIEDKFVDDRGRGKIVWAYCYCLDRQISIRVGKPFWHRSPGMTIQHLHFDPADDFPQMREIDGLQDDHAAYLQCLMHITQVLSNAHDLLYPSKSHSLAIAKAEHYYKHIDEFTEALSAFRNRWQKKPWRTYPINEPLEYFPTGLMGSVDARFIIEAMNAGADVLRLAVGRFQPSGALAYLPLRFFLFFSHAGVFLLKAAMIVPLPPSQKRAIIHLIRGLIKCMSMASSDHRHPAVRNSSALDGLLRRIYRDHDIQTPAVTCPSSPGIDSSGPITNSTEAAAATKTRPSDTDLPTFLGNRESPFVAERPLQELAADIDAIFGLETDNLDFSLPPNTENTSNDLPTIVPASDIFTSLFNYDDREFWGGFTPMTLD